MAGFSLGCFSDSLSFFFQAVKPQRSNKWSRPTPLPPSLIMVKQRLQNTGLARDFRRSLTSSKPLLPGRMSRVIQRGQEAVMADQLISSHLVSAEDLQCQPQITKPVRNKHAGATVVLWVGGPAAGRHWVRPLFTPSTHER